MNDIEELERQSAMPDLDATFYKQMIGKAILFRVAHKLVRPMFPAFQGNVAAYLVSVAANRIGNRLDLDKIWHQQDLSIQLKQQLQAWAIEVNGVLQQSAVGRMISEWAKKKECWDIVRAHGYSNPINNIPELR